MSVKTSILFIVLLVGSYAFPVEDGEADMSKFFDHSESTGRIVGGTVAGPVPHMVALTAGVFYRGFLCGGSLITTKHALTAAHCIAAAFRGGALPRSLRGYVNTNHFNSGGTGYAISGNITHVGYQHSTLKNDIGIFIFSTNVALSNTVSLVPLNFNFIGAGVATTANGWGTNTPGGPLSQVLMQLSGTVIDGAQCVTRVAERVAQLPHLGNIPPVDPNIEICSFHSAGQGMCHGDSGSALLRSDNNQQIGIVSWGLPCARNAPDVFVRISAFQSWILQNTR